MKRSLNGKAVFCRAHLVLPQNSDKMIFGVLSIFLELFKSNFIGFFVIISHFLNKILRINLHSPDTVTISPRMHTKQVTSECLLCLVRVYSANVSLHYTLRGIISDSEKDVQTNFIAN